MSQLFGLLYQARNILLFIFLEAICIVLIKNKNIRWNVAAFNSTNNVSGQILSKTSSFKDYLKLKEANLALAAENEKLNNQVIKFQSIVETTEQPAVDSAFASRFDYTVAKIIDNSVHLTDNYFTINKGTKDGLKAGMGVVGPSGIVGQLKACSNHFCVGYSILHSRFNVSSEVKNDSISNTNEAALGIAKWPGKDPYFVQLKTILKYKPVFLGDSIVTSNQNAIFPGGIPIGKISKLGVESNNTFHDIEVKLSTDFSNLIYVYVLKNKLLDEQKQLQSEAIPAVL